MKLAIVGVTGLVGGVVMEVLNERNFHIDEFIPVASARSAGKVINFKGKDYTIVTNEEAVAMEPDIAIFSAGGGTSLEWAPKYEAAGTTVIDNSSAWRMSPDHQLCVPEINASNLAATDKIIANPNCSTIQMVAALAPLHEKYGIKRLVISTYQSYTGTGMNAVAQYNNEKETGKYDAGVAAYPHPIFANCIPHCDVFLDNGYTKEEMKLVHETRKILGDDTIKITATAVRVPVNGGHSEAVSLNLWIVSDNLRKGAATNAVQIAEYLVSNEMA